MNKEDLQILIQMLKSNRQDLALKLFPKKDVHLVSEMLVDSGKLPDIQVLFLEKKTHVWHCLSPKMPNLAYAWGQALKDHHDVLFKKGKEIINIKGIVLFPKETIDVMRNLLTKPIYTSTELDECVYKGYPIEYKEKTFTYKVVKVEKIIPTDRTTKSVPALSTSLPLRYEENEVIGKYPVFPQKKLHRVPSYKSRGHNGWQKDRDNQLPFKPIAAQLPLIPGESVEEDVNTFKVFTDSPQRYSFWIREAQKRGAPIRLSKPSRNSTRGTFRVSFYKTRALWEAHTIRHAN